MKVEKIGVRLEGLSDIMFDKFIDHSEQQRPPEQKLYLAEGNKVVLPADNIFYFLFAEKPEGAVKVFEKKKARPIRAVGMSSVIIDPLVIPLEREGEEVVFREFGKGGLYVYWASPIVKKGTMIIKQEQKARPALKLPWSLSFTISLIKNDTIDSERLHNWFDQGGLVVGVGTYRPRFGRFAVEKWEVK